MTDFFISDNHWGHANVIQYENRPFRSVEEMDTEMVRLWNSVVDKNDLVFHLGDFSFYNKAMTADIVRSLNGRIVLIKGNHDGHSNAWYRDVGFHEVSKWPIIYQGFLILSHEPVYLQASTPYRNVHGHVHGRSLSSSYHCNVSVEVLNYLPVPFDRLVLDRSDVVPIEEG